MCFSVYYNCLRCNFAAHDKTRIPGFVTHVYRITTVPDNAVRRGHTRGFEWISKIITRVLWRSVWTPRYGHSTRYAAAVAVMIGYRAFRKRLVLFFYNIK